MKFSRVLLSFAVIALVTLSGCTRAPKYRPRPLTKLTKETADYHQTQDNVTVMAKKFTSMQTFDPAKRIETTRLNKRIETIQLTIENTNPTTMLINSKDVSLPLISAKNIIKKNSHSVLAPLIDYGALGILSLPLGVLGLAGMLVSTMAASIPMLVFTGGLFLGSGSLFITAPTIGIINAVKTANVNKLIEADIEEKTLSTLTIQPNETKNTLIFVHTKDLPNEFNLKVAHEEDANKTIDFTISLLPKIQSEPLFYKG